MDLIVIPVLPLLMQAGLLATTVLKTWTLQPKSLKPKYINPSLVDAGWPPGYYCP